LKIAVLSYLLLFLSVIGYGQNTAILKGNVYDKNNYPISNAFIKIKETGATAYSVMNGSYAIPIPANQAFTVQVSYTKSVVEHNIGKVNAGQVFRLDITLDHTTIIGGAVVTGEKIREYPSVIKIEPKKLERFANTGGFETNLKLTAIGLSTAGGELSSGYSVRGGNFDENLVYINDIEIYRPFLVRSGQQEGLSVINADLVDYVEFSAGGFQAKYGDKLSSVLDIKYREPDTFASTVQASLLGINVHVEDRLGERFSYLIGFRYRSNQYLLGSLDVQGDYKPRFFDAQSLLKYRFTSDLSLSLLSTVSQNRYLVVPQSRRTSFGNINSALSLNIAFGGQELMQYTTLMNGLSLVYKPSDKINLKLNTSAYNTTEREHFTVEGAYRLSELETNLGSDDFANVKRILGVGYFIDHARNDLSANVYTAAHKGKYYRKKSIVSWGVRYTNEQITDRLKEWRYNDSSEYNISTTTDTSLKSAIVLDEFLKASIDLRSSRVSAFVQNNHRINDTYNFRATYGLRSNYWTYNNENVISPRLQMSFEPNKRFNDILKLNDSLRRTEKDSLMKRDWVVKFAAGYYYQPPFYRELRGITGELNPDIKAQKSIHFVLGGDMNFKAWNRPFKFISEIYYKDLDRMIPYVVDNVRIRYLAENSSKGYGAGFDARVNGEFIEGIESWLNFSILQTKERLYYFDENGVEQLSNWLRRPTDQRVNFSILFQDELPQNPSYKLNLSLVYGSKLPFFFDANNRHLEGFSIPAYRRVDIGFSKVLIDSETENRPTWLKNANSLWMSLEIFNLLQVNNTISYVLVKDFSNNVYGVPNYLTGRRLNLRFILKI
jgi:hypothetical protein